MALRIRHLLSQKLLVKELEVADTQDKKAKGLLDRDFPPEGFGMFFPGVSTIHTMGMEFPIDVLFLGRRLQVLGVEEQLPPEIECVASPGAKHTLELPAGTLDRLPVAVGDQLAMEGRP